MTATRLCLVAHATTPALRRATFGTGAADDVLDASGRRAASALAGHPALSRMDTWLAAPTRAAGAASTPDGTAPGWRPGRSDPPSRPGPAAQTAEALGWPGVTLEPALADCDYGDWTGRTLDEIAAADPDGVRRWLTDPAAAPHGGESVTALIRRVGDWLDRYADSGRRAAAVTHAAVIRAAMTYVMRAPPASFRCLDVVPLAVVRLSARDGRWRIELSRVAPVPTGHR